MNALFFLRIFAPARELAAVLLGACLAAGCTPPPTGPVSFSTTLLAREPTDALLESVKKVGLYPTTVSPGLIETRWEETTHTGEPLHEQQTKLVRRYLLRIEKRAFDNRVTIEAQAKRCIPATLRFGESEVDGKCAPVPTLPPPLLTELHRTADRLEQLFTIP
ncbi:MAG: hypothetical protein KAY55_05465 [Deltaproteobacteria bacterium]|jgi:hypothetical protein|nr:hypothetical protein [Deltaproteobacteria bacterium]